MAFRFRMATILKLREQERDERRRELALALEAERRLRARVAELQSEIETLRVDMRRSAAPGEIRIDGLIQFGRYEMILKAEIATIEKQIQLVMQEAERRRLALVEGDRQVKVLEKLRERRREQFEATEANREMKRLDEVASGAFHRSREEAV